MKNQLLSAVVITLCTGCQTGLKTTISKHPQLNSTPIAQALHQQPQAEIEKRFGLPNLHSTPLPDMEQWTYQHTDDKQGTACEMIITFRNQVVEATVVKVTRPYLTAYLTSPCKIFEIKAGIASMMNTEQTTHG